MDTIVIKNITAHHVHHYNVSNDIMVRYINGSDFSPTPTMSNLTTISSSIEPWCHDLQSNDLLYTATHHASPLKQIVAVVFLVLLVFTVVGNAFVILVVLIDRRLRRITSGLIVSMAVADLLVGLSMELHGVIMVFDQSNAHLSSIMCELSISIDVYFALCELLHLTCLAVERYVAICHPFLYERCGKKFLSLIIVLAWSIPFLFSFFPILTMWHKLRQEEIYHCMVDLHIERCVFFPNQIFSTVLFIVMFVFPTALLLFCYTKILQVALTHRRRIDTQTTLGSYIDSQLENVICDQPNGEELPKSKSLNKESSFDECITMVNFDRRNMAPDKEITPEIKSKQPEDAPFIEIADTVKSVESTVKTHQTKATNAPCDNSNTKSIKEVKPTAIKPSKSSVHSNGTAATSRNRWRNICRAIFGIDDFFRTSRSIVYVCISFILTWTPYWTLTLISPFIGPQNIPKAAVLVAISLFSLGTAINPFVYYFCNTDVRRGIFRVLKRLCFKYGRCCDKPDF